MNTAFGSFIAGTVALVCLSACAGVSDLTKQQVARSETAVKQAETSIGKSEAGAIELQQAKDNYAQAQKALEAKNETTAQRYANQAELNAQLAVAKAQNASARKAADELLASIQTLRQETDRAGTTPR
ncbi:chromosome segregation ATPase [Povalibacter uvarum]|uniref:Chromosome segregation ATPase n=1 Tax=Povalibacter uvarum TaxID=732238 RepID=A0A841HJ99_9GAMM|nr:DUF4398 domain-containing protein [Povalibacter uvarum]MBB6092876.1 chromosome segregation ATPase [Povalibacter uvarum]